ncbi:6-phosphogluconolactonase [Desulfobulbus alkaliphilus]|uniref:6-phosphogluconolactonase n=1 Tax=Desulfobulbus alkaliphilus TaxID=869814 RepID=UPI001962F660|nr:6-phosphogluconolactonase [Desulfobulbus alkaliphilus]MBM9537902.1 6-phosphogluconolactonase [Desulfobulbus alkaliphilus]
MLTVIENKDQDQLLRSAGHYLIATIRDLFTKREQINLAVPGGRSVAKIFQNMQTEHLDWQRVHFFIIDERLVSIEHPDSNYRLLQEHFIAPLVRAKRIDPDNVHPFIFEPALADRGTRNYERVLATHGFRYDIILLSAGEDGHVGALYPNHHSLASQHHGFIVMDDSPKPPRERMTSSRSLMQTADCALLLFVGEAKQGAYEQFMDAACPVNDCPAKLVLTLPEIAVFTDLSPTGS